MTGFGSTSQDSWPAPKMGLESGWQRSGTANIVVKYVAWADSSTPQQSGNAL